MGKEQDAKLTFVEHVAAALLCLAHRISRRGRDEGAGPETTTGAR